MLDRTGLFWGRFGLCAGRPALLLDRSALCLSRPDLFLGRSGLFLGYVWLRFVFVLGMGTYSSIWDGMATYLFFFLGGDGDFFFCYLDHIVVDYCIRRQLLLCISDIMVAA